MPITVAIESPLQDEVRSLIADLNAAMNAQAPDTPADFHFRMTAEQMARPDTIVWIARSEGQAVGCGALLSHPEGYGEVKRMYVCPEVQGQGVAKLILDEIIAKAISDGLSHLALETGDKFLAARRLYEGAGFVRCGVFADYPDSQYSIFYRKELTGASAAA